MQISKARKIIGWVLCSIPILALVGAVIAKLTRQPEIVEKLGSINIHNIQILGGILLICLILYLIPKTSNIGFFLLCSYLGGIIVGRIAQGESPMIGIGLATLLYVGTMFRKPELSGLEI